MRIRYITRNGNIIAVQKKESCHLMVLFFGRIQNQRSLYPIECKASMCVSNILLPCKRKRTSNDFDKIVQRLAEFQTSARRNSKRCSNQRADLCLQKCVNTYVRRTNRPNFSIVKKRISVQFICFIYQLGLNLFEQIATKFGLVYFFYYIQVLN